MLLTIELLSAARVIVCGAAGARAGARRRALPPPLPLPVFGAAARPSIRTIVIDPGHGGDDTGVKGPGGTLEKDVALDVARRVKSAIETRLGIRVLLTREERQPVDADGRAAIANNNKADLYISLHANGSPRPETRGATIFYTGPRPVRRGCAAPVAGRSRGAAGLRRRHARGRAGRVGAGAGGAHRGLARRLPALVEQKLRGARDLPSVHPPAGADARRWPAPTCRPCLWRWAISRIPKRRSCWRRPHFRTRIAQAHDRSRRRVPRICREAPAVPDRRSEQ